jgi:alkaline phosphatase D
MEVGLVDRPIDRRTFLKYSLASAVVWGGVGGSREAGLDPEATDALFAVGGAAAAPAQVFPLSVASGDPAPNGIVLWTRIAPPRGGAARGVAFEVATDAAFTNRVLRGIASTSAARDNTLKIQLDDARLQPFTTYYYRFIFKRVASPVGRFKTLPAPGQAIDRLRLAYISCQDFTNGFYTAHRFLADEDLDYVVNLGDYIYETAGEASFQGAQVRRVQFPSGRDRAEDAADYRFLYRTYKSDPNLQRVHERFAMISIWDDHEFANDCYRDFDSDTGDPAQNQDAQRRKDANQVWAEYTPTGIPFNAAGGPLDSIQIYRTYPFGTLAELVLTDERLYRDPQPYGVGTADKYAQPDRAPADNRRTAPGRTVLGAAQKEFFVNTITGSPRLWKLWGNEVQVSEFLIANAPRKVFLNLDAWDGYVAERNEILARIADAGVKNFVALTGDIHTFIAAYLRRSYDTPYVPNPLDLDAPPPDVVGAEFVVGSVTSANLEEIATNGRGAPVGNLPGGQAPAEILLERQPQNPHFVYLNSTTHGYNIIEVTPAALTCTMRAVSTIQAPEATLRTLRTFRIAANSARIETL